MPPSNPIRVVIADNHVLVRSALRMILNASPNIHVVGEVDSKSRTNGATNAEPPQVVLFDLDDESGMDNLRQFLATHDMPVIGLSGLLEDDSHYEAVRLGLRGLVLKVQEPAVLVKAIQKVHCGDLWLSRTLMAQVLGQFIRPASTPAPDAPLHTALTDREREVVRLLSQGMKNQQIGAQLHISESTVRHHLTSIYSKLYISDRLELLIYAYRHGLAPLP